MIRKLIEWSVHNKLVVILVAVGLALFGGYAFWFVNVEAYPDPAPAIVEVVAQYPGASTEEVERQVTIPLEVALAGMPGLTYTRSKSLFGLSHLRNQFDYGIDFEKARQEVINRLTFTRQLPANVGPQISPQSPTGEIYRYTLKSPKDRDGNDVYTLNDLKALQDWVLERDFRRVPRIIDVTSTGGTVKRYEVHPDADRLRRYGVTLQQLQNALGNSNQNVGGDYLTQGHMVLNVRSVGLYGGGADPVHKVLAFEAQARDEFEADQLRLQPAASRERLRKALAGEKVDPPLTAKERAVVENLRRIRLALARRKVPPPYPERPGWQTVKTLWERLQGHKVDVKLTDNERRQVESIERRSAERAARVIRDEERRRIREIRQVVITSINNKPIRVEHVVEGGPVLREEDLGKHGVVVGHQTRLGRVSLSKPVTPTDPVPLLRIPEPRRPAWRDEDDKVQAIILLRKGEDSPPALADVRKKVEELNDPASGRMLPGVQIETYYDRGHLINLTTETVRENLLLGMVLVTVVLLMFLSNVRTALIVAVNIPLALLFAFSILFLRGKSANLLSIGAVDFGIIVDSSVIMVENIYRHLASGENAELPIQERIIRASREIDRALFYSTAIMVCAFIPLFTMTGPEGQLFGPMADTYAFALGGALLLALTLAPVLCVLLFKNLKPKPDNFLMRFLRNRYLWQLERCLKYRWATITAMGALIVVTGSLLFLKRSDGTPLVGREFMPQLEEGNLWITATFPLNSSMERVAQNIDQARKIIASYPEVEVLVPAIGRPDDGTDPTGYYRVEIFAPLKPEQDWPKVEPEKSWWRRWLWGGQRRRTKDELEKQMDAELRAKLPGVDWNFSQYIRDNVTEALAGVKGDNAVKIFGPDLDKLEELAGEVKRVLTSKEEGKRIRGIEQVGIYNVKGQTNLEFRIDLDKCAKWGVSAADVNNVIQSAVGGKAMTTMIEGEKFFDVSIRWPGWQRSSEESILEIPLDITNNTVVIAGGPGPAPSPQGSGQPTPAPKGTLADTSNPITNTPRLRLRDLVSPVGPDGAPDPKGSFERSGASTIYREQGKRYIAIKFNVRDRDLASAVAEAREKTDHLFQPPYQAVWAGEFQQMERAEARLFLVIPLSLGLIFILLYMAFNSFLDAFVVLSNVLALAVGGIWALYLTGTHFSISAAVGFVSLFGVAIMDGLLLISYFNALRAQGLPLHDAIMQGAAKRVRAVMITALTAILGLLPAALSTRIGAQTQQPLAIVVVGGMLTTLFLTRYLMPVLYSFYGQRQPPTGAGSLAH
jgi:cobalt-zinc-cadmium resistance protein CzcA